MRGRTRYAVRIRRTAREFLHLYIRSTDLVQCQIAEDRRPMHRYANWFRARDVPSSYRAPISDFLSLILTLSPTNVSVGRFSYAALLNI